MEEKFLPRAWKGTLDVSRMMMLLGFIQGRLKLVIFFFKFFFPFIMLLSVSVWRKWRFSENDRQGWGELRSPLRPTNSWVESTRVRIQLYHLKGIMWAERRGQKLHETPFSPKTIVSWRKDDFFFSCTDISQDLSQGMFVQQFMDSARMLPAHILDVSGGENWISLLFRLEKNHPKL